MLTPDYQVKALIEAGLLPADAERVVEEALARGGRPMTDVELDAQAAEDAAPDELDRAAWLAWAAVPRLYKRLLAATPQLPRGATEDNPPDEAA